MSIRPPDIAELAARVVAAYRAHGLMVATAESCTGGLVAAALTEVPGSSAVLDRGFVTYSNAAKHEQLGVGVETIASFGAVSVETARAMAEGALRNSHAHTAVSITGIAGPDGGSPSKPVGTVIFGLARRGHEPSTTVQNFSGDRAAVRAQATLAALELLLP